MQVVILDRTAAITFGPADVDLTTTPFPHPELVAGHRQVTEVYLLQLAIQYSGHLIALDYSSSSLTRGLSAER